LVRGVSPVIRRPASAAARSIVGRPGLRSRQLLGKYRIERRIAQGGFGEVYRAYDTIEGVPVALKIPFAHLVGPQLLQDFRREVRLMAALDHPSILPIKNAQFIGQHFVIAYPLGEGTLGDRMQKRSSLALRVSYATQMLAAVAHAHEHKIIHCDLKPENFILFTGNRLRLTDFGISRLARTTIVVSGSGTVGYVAPEQAMGRSSLRSDVFSLGLLFYEMFARALPSWPFRWPMEGADQLKARVHPEFVSFLRRALELDPHKRFRDAQQMESAFLRLQQRGQVLPAARKPRRKAPAAPDWNRLRQRQFLRLYKTPLQLHTECGRCRGPISEAMTTCPWCSNSPARYRGETRHTHRCTRCGRGRKPDWRYCAWCHGPGFARVSERSYSDRAYSPSRRCGNPSCERRLLMPFMRYCPWCKRKVRQRWKIPGTKHKCGRCGWGVHPDFWSHCPWCGKTQGNGRKTRK